MTDVAWEDLPTEVIKREQQCWTFHPQGTWHGYAGYSDGYAMVDPNKLTLLTPGIDREDGRVSRLRRSCDGGRQLSARAADHFGFGLAILRFPPFVTIFAGALLGGVLAVVFNANQVIAFAKDASLPAPLALIKGIWSALATGYVSNTGQAEIDRLLSRGGMEVMLNTVWLILTALAFGAVLERAGLLKRLTEAAISGVRSTGSLVVAVVGTCIGLNVIASDQYIAIVLPARMFRVEFDRRGLLPVALSRAVGDWQR